ncbi:hypothetical protein [Coleofasciculus sp. H7-2]|uniref:hypothetical protein n=1 Tax=Coleofasciculus sp. H7-2 TaxID=3351545 RepID=UPI00366F5C40
MSASPQSVVELKSASCSLYNFLYKNYEWVIPSAACCILETKRIAIAQAGRSLSITRVPCHQKQCLWNQRNESE